MSANTIEQSLPASRLSACVEGRRSVAELMNLTGRTAIVTGGGGHLGEAICETLAELGANVAVLDCQEDACRKTACRIADDYQVSTLPLAVDLRDEAETRAVCDCVVGRFGRLDILVNCAAFVGASNLAGWVTEFSQQSTEAWRMALELNLTAPFALTQSCAAALAQHGTGSVINIGSIYGLVGPDLRVYEQTAMGNPAAYAASKGGLLQLTRWLSTVLAPHIRVNSISPGGILRGQPERFQEQYVARTPLRRMGREEDLKGAAAYLAGDLSAYVTGQNLVIDGGWMAW